MQVKKVLLINPGYDVIFLGLSCNNIVTTTRSVHKHQASKSLIATIDHILQENHTTLQDLTYIAVNVGPGPFTTLRVAIATINGLAYGANIPLISVDGFELVAHHALEQCTTPYLAILLNAFSNDVYGAMYSLKTDQKKTVCTPITEMIEHLKTLNAQEKNKPSLTICGNGTQIYQEQLQTLEPGSYIITALDTETDQLATMALKANQAFTNNESKKMLLPHYMKATSALIKK